MPTTPTAEPRRTNVLPLAALIVSVLLVAAALVAVAPRFAAAAASPVDTEALSADLFAATNERRVSLGVAPLVRDEALDALAADWAIQLAADGELSHRGELGEDTAVFVGTDGWSVAAENVGRGPSIDVIAAAFVASADHRANIDDPGLTRVGVGVVERGGELWVAVNFTG